MPYNGSGTFNRLYSWVVDAANSLNISSSRTDAEMNGFAAGLTNCITRDGQSPPSADTPWGAKKITNLGAATVGTDALNRDTADARYILTSISSLSLAGSLTAATSLNGATLAISGNATIGGSIVASGSITTFDGGYFYTPFNGVTNTGLVRSGIQCDGTNQTLNFYTANTYRGGFNSSGILSLTGSITCATPTVGDNSTKAATTAYVITALTPYAPLSSPTFTGVPAGPTAAPGTNTTQLATTAFITAAVTAGRNPQGQTITSAATATPTFSDDFVEITAQAVGLTLANPTGSAANMWGIAIRIKDNGSPQTISFGTQYRAIGTTLPTTTVAGKTLILGMVFNNALTKWDVVSVAKE